MSNFSTHQPTIRATYGISFGSAIMSTNDTTHWFSICSTFTSTYPTTFIPAIIIPNCSTHNPTVQTAVESAFNKTNCTAYYSSNRFSYFPAVTSSLQSTFWAAKRRSIISTIISAIKSANFPTYSDSEWTTI